MLGLWIYRCSTLHCTSRTALKCMDWPYKLEDFLSVKAGYLSVLEARQKVCKSYQNAIDEDMSCTVAVLHQGAPVWLEDPSSWLSLAYCFASVIV